ncbi:MAG: OprD family outer membrane porin, partial [Pseudolabrys sp.]
MPPSLPARIARPRRRRGHAGAARIAASALAAASLAACAALLTTTSSRAQSAAPAPAAGRSAHVEPRFNRVLHNDIATQFARHAAPPVPHQPHMREIYWRDVMGRDFPPGTPPFIRDSLVQFVARSYYYTRDNSDGSRSRAWTGGGWLAWRSGLIGNVLGVQAAFYTSQKLFGPDTDGGSKLLAPVQKPLNVLGQAFARLRVFGQELRGGRQLVDTPLINPQDNRMVPNTFEGITLNSPAGNTRSFDYTLGYLWTVKQRDSNDFIAMSDALADKDTANRGAPFALVKLRPFPGLSATFMDYYVEDFVNTGFAQAEYEFQGRRVLRIGSSASTSSISAASEATCSPGMPSKPIRRQRSCRCPLWAGPRSWRDRSLATDRTSTRRSAPSRTTPTCNRSHSTMRARRPSAAAWPTISATHSTGLP